MKVYTEVVYTWDDNKGELVEESSKSFDYEGEVTQCWGMPSFSMPSFTPKVMPKISFSMPELPKIKLPKVPTITPPNIGTGSGGTLGSALQGLNTTMSDAGSALSTNIQSGLGAVQSGLDQTVGTAGMAIATGLGKLLPGAGGGDAGETDQARPGSDAGDRHTTMGEGGQGGMKSASMEGVKKTAAGASGKRRLRKIKGKGSSGARV